MGLLYSATFENVSMTDAAQDIIAIATSANVPIVIHEFAVTAGVTTDVRARVQILRRTTAGSAGTSITPRALHQRNTVSSATTVTYLRTTPGTAGDQLDSEQWSLLVPFQRLYTPETRIVVNNSGFIALNLVAGTGAARNISGRVVFEEI